MGNLKRLKMLYQMRRFLIDQFSLAEGKGMDSRSAPGGEFGLEGLNWETICEICQWEGVGPILYTAISKENRVDIPEELKNNLKALYLLSHFRNLYFLKELRGLLGLFKKNNIPLMLLKGVALISTVYDNPAHRPMSDIDLMIREEDLEKAHLLILKKGYKLIGLEYWPWWRKFGGERSYIKNSIRIDLPLFFGLKEARELFGASIPEIIKENPPSFGWLNYFPKFQGETEIGGNLIKLIMLPGTINKFIFLLGALFPSPDFLQTWYQTKRKMEAYLYFFLRPFLIAHKCMKELYPILS
jgi:hypothetical protein